MDPNIIIDELGGTVAVSLIFEITDGAVSQWRQSGIPKARLMYLKLLRPDVFARLESNQPSQEQAGIKEAA